MMNQDFKDIISQIEITHYFDQECWFKDVLQTPYDIIVKDGFGIIIENYQKFGGKIGFSRGGIRFNKKEKSLEEYKTFIDYLKIELKKRKYIFVGIDHLEIEDSFNSIFEKSDYRDYIQGTALIYPKKDWIMKFNSKKRYDLNSGTKKGLETEFISNIPSLPVNSGSQVDLDKFYDLANQTFQRQGLKYPFLSKDACERLFSNVHYMLTIAKKENQWVAYNLSLLTPDLKRMERLYAGASEEGTKLRAPSLIEVKLIETLSDMNIEIYDLWGIRDGAGYSDFKKSLSDEVIYFKPLSVIKVNPPIAHIILFLIKSMRIINK
jgi:hypothetical protein